MSAVVYFRVMAVIAALAGGIAAWRLVVHLAEQNYGWVAVMAICVVLDAALFVYWVRQVRS